jgi:hypothetical protein
MAGGGGGADILGCVNITTDLSKKICVSSVKIYESLLYMYDENENVHLILIDGNMALAGHSTPISLFAFLVDTKCCILSSCVPVGSALTEIR